MSVHSTEEAYWYHRMRREMPDENCFHRPPTDRGEELFAQDVRRLEGRRTYGPTVDYTTYQEVIDSQPTCELCDAINDLRLVRQIWAKHRKLNFWRCVAHYGM